MVKENEPNRVFVDFISNNNAFALVNTRKLVSYDIHKLNELRNHFSKTDIDISDESVFIMAGKYVCIKQFNPQTNYIDLLFYDAKFENEILNAIKNLSDTNKFIMSSILEYINGNYDLVSTRVELIKEIPGWILDANS